MCYNLAQTVRAVEKGTRYYNAVPKNGQIMKDFYSVSGFAHPDLLVISSEEPQYLQQFSWGLIPNWVKEEKKANELADMCLNARSETVFEKPSFRSITKKRCILPVDGFFEWRTEGKAKYPYYIYPKKDEGFTLGCLYDTWTNRTTGEIINSFSILTTEANPLMAQIHNSKLRMPLILSDEVAGKWLDPSLKQNELLGLMKPYPEAQMQAHTISKLITSRTQSSNVPEVIQPFEYPELKAAVN